jgi:hypothetical protein
MHCKSQRVNNYILQSFSILYFENRINLKKILGHLTPFSREKYISKWEKNIYL